MIGSEERAKRGILKARNEEENGIWKRQKRRCFGARVRVLLCATCYILCGYFAFFVHTYLFFEVILMLLSTYLGDITLVKASNIFKS